MTTLCVAGGTGQVGREVVRQGLEAGHTVSVLSRHVPTPGSEKHHDGATYFAGDVTTGDGLAAAVAGADVVIDCLEGRLGKAQKQFAGGGARLLSAARQAGVRKAVALSIINCDQSNYSFYVSKADKERIYARADIETVVVRATQFHSLVEMVFRAGAKARLIPAFKGVRFQSISPTDAAAALLEAALEAPSPERHRVRTIGGPEVLAMKDMAESWKAITGARGRVVEVPLPGAMGAYLRAGLNLVPEQRYGAETFVSWLEKRRETL
ncbi:NAD(P)H-binding protein [Arthrobacter sp. StoSoilB5]|uniref:SDR family oxidoreductase n=1 Tax=Arthrobacter sp. StoSoilB5 TaxID=2830992 RepID=UPI001CC4A5CD|nr:NAD(P)H-binding protein [Arthrobacter sp. StoSoilB5]BCW46324.1 nucleotide-diphosphate-sugar epimerase [Arthrobacter sp. StoSoilB5]